MGQEKGLDWAGGGGGGWGLWGAISPRGPSPSPLLTVAQFKALEGHHLCSPTPTHLQGDPSLQGRARVFRYSLSIWLSCGQNRSARGHVPAKLIYKSKASACGAKFADPIHSVFFFK